MIHAVEQYLKNFSELKICFILNIISPDQTDFIPGRYIGENTRLIYDLRQYAEENDIHGVLLMIDFE